MHRERNLPIMAERKIGLYTEEERKGIIKSYREKERKSDMERKRDNTI